MGVDPQYIAIKQHNKQRVEKKEKRKRK